MKQKQQQQQIHSQIRLLLKIERQSLYIRIENQ